MTSMKKTTRISLVLLATVSVMALAGCGSSEEDKAKQVDTRACASENLSGQCNSPEYQSALSEHNRTAPKYGSQGDCESIHGGKCGTDSVTGMFMPFMAGMLISNMMNGGSRAVPYYNTNEDERRRRYGGGGATGYVGGTPYYNNSGIARSAAPQANAMMTSTGKIAAINGQGGKTTGFTSAPAGTTSRIASPGGVSPSSSSASSRGGFSAPSGVSSSSS